MRATNHIVWKEPRRVNPVGRREPPTMEARGCAPCAGTGHVLLSEEAAFCPVCNGRGWVWAVKPAMKLEFDI